MIIVELRVKRHVGFLGDQKYDTRELGIGARFQFAFDSIGGDFVHRFFAREFEVVFIELAVNKLLNRKPEKRLFVGSASRSHKAARALHEARRFDVSLRRNLDQSIAVALLAGRCKLGQSQQCSVRLAFPQHRQFNGAFGSIRIVNPRVHPGQALIDGGLRKNFVDNSAALACRLVSGLSRRGRVIRSHALFCSASGESYDAEDNDERRR